MSPERSRICHVITMLELGGAQQNTLHTVTHLDPSRFEPILVTGTEGPLVDDARRSGVRTHFVASLVRPVSPGKDLKALYDLTRLLRRERPAVVHTHSSKAGILGRAAPALARVPIVVHSIHGWGFHRGQSPLAHALYVFMERSAARGTTAFVAVSRANLEQEPAPKILAGRRTVLIRSGIPLGRFRPADEPPPPVPPPWDPPPPGGATVGMVACLKPQKAPEDFVRVAAKASAQAPSARFVLVGDGELRGKVESLARALRLEGKLHLAGWRRDVPDLMRSFDVLLHTSRWEGLPRVLPEAMATALPVVATRVDGAPEAIEDGVNGYLFDPGDVEGMARAVVRLIRDRELRATMGRAGRARVGAWDIDEMVRAQERLYEGLIGRLARRHYTPERGERNDHEEPPHDA